MSNEKDRKRLEWRLNVVMSEKRIKTVTELKRRLERVGVNISSAQLGRIVWEKPQKLNMELLEGLVTVLDCDVSEIIKASDIPAMEIIERKPESQSQAPAAAKEPKQRVRPIVVESTEDLTGPKLTPFPIPDRKR